MPENDVIPRGLVSERAVGVENQAPKHLIMTAGELALLDPNQIADLLAAPDSSDIDMVKGRGKCETDNPDIPPTWVLA